jgi:hypothetical protein
MSETRVIPDVYCKHCDTSYPKTTEHFYTCNGKLKTDKCKNCKKVKMREYRENKKDNAEPKIRKKRVCKEPALKINKTSYKYRNDYLVEYHKRDYVKAKRNAYQKEYRASLKENLNKIP